MTTPARIEANRRNALKSTGPRTLHGKTIASHNALRHGLRARNALLPGEDPAEFHEFLARLSAEFSPASLSQELLLDQMATAYWKLARLQLIEKGVYASRSQKSEIASIFSEALSSDDSEPEPEPPPPGSAEALAAAYLRDSNGCRAFRSLSYDEGRLERSYFRAYRELAKQTQSSRLFSTNRSPEANAEANAGTGIAPAPPPAGQ